MSEQKIYNKQLPKEERIVLGKSIRKQVPRSSHGDWTPATDRPDPLDLLQAQDKGRLQDLLPIKYGRMVASPFAFLRGSAVVMASDLAASPVSGQNVLLCGDAQAVGMVIFFPMMFLSGAGMPLQLLPEGLRKVSDFLPLTYVVRLIQGLWFGELWSDLWLPVLVLIGMLVIATAAAARMFRWE